MENFIELGIDEEITSNDVCSENEAFLENGINLGIDEEITGNDTFDASWNDGIESLSSDDNSSMSSNFSSVSVAETDVIVDDMENLNGSYDPNEYIKHPQKLMLTDEIWKKIFDEKTRELDSFSYPSIIAAELSKIVKCVINIRKKNIGKKGISIWAYCAHGRNESDPLEKCYQFKLFNSDMSSGHFDIYYNNV